ncbi:acyl-CoA dehydrogenase family protein [Nonomuraea sp. NPDC049758]|uniref:acyl-CoA dehydrogenase family protein n=1 Tax=Nonomuraea sp. NPDC049758 TaxID=3154360 RepID=UPI00343DD468
MLSRFIGNTVAGATAADPHDVWKRLSAAGFDEFVRSVDAGGLGLGPLEFCLVFEELGARLCDPHHVRGALLAAGLRDDGRPGEASEVFRTPQPATEPGTPLPVLVPSPGFELGTSTDEVARAFDRDRLMVAAYLAGVARRALGLARARGADRLLGGRPLLERQSVAHNVARAAVTAETARLEVWEAADRGEAYLVLTALASALEAAVANAHLAVQLHGAAGTSCPQVIDVYGTAYAAAATWGPPSSLWREAARRRYPEEGTA